MMVGKMVGKMVERLDWLDGKMVVTSAIER
jgi:hypothetical protein